MVIQEALLDAVHGHVVVVLTSTEPVPPLGPGWFGRPISTDDRSCRTNASFGRSRPATDHPPACLHGDLARSFAMSSRGRGQHILAHPAQQRLARRGLGRAALGSTSCPWESSGGVRRGGPNDRDRALRDFSWCECGALRAAFCAAAVARPSGCPASSRSGPDAGPSRGRSENCRSPSR